MMSDNDDDAAAADDEDDGCAAYTGDCGVNDDAHCGTICHSEPLSQHISEVSSAPTLLRRNGVGPRAVVCSDISKASYSKQISLLKLQKKGWN